MVRRRQGRAGGGERGPAAGGGRRAAAAGGGKRGRTGGGRRASAAGGGRRGRTGGGRRGPAGPRRPMSAPVAGALGLAVVLAAAAVLRVWALARAPVNPFYDAAVRSMGLSWHNFFFGALDPGGRISVDKPPIDLWLQVASTKLFGFNTTALLLPEALGGIVAAGLLYATIRPVFGLGAAMLAGLALAVLPISVVTSRSDTMDSVMRPCSSARSGRRSGRCAPATSAGSSSAAAIVGLAFNVKLSEALVPLPALA